MKLKQLTITFLSFCIGVFAGAKSADAATFTVLADGLNNAKGLSFGPDGSLYVTEAGIGGNGACVASPSAQGNSLCYGATGAITKIGDGTAQQILTGLPSLALPDGTGAAGPHDIEFDAIGNPYILLGYAANPALRVTALGDTELGSIIAPDFSNNSWTSLADIAQYELRNNPDQGDIVSNPLSFVIDDDRFVVVDAGANDLLSVNTDGSDLTELAIFPQRALTNPIFPPSDEPSVEPSQVPPPSTFDDLPQSQFTIQSVPSGIAKGPDGAYYVSEYTGFPFPEGGARIYRVDANDQPTVYADGFTQLTDLAFDSEGNLYALQYANQSAWKGNLDGSLIKVAPDGSRLTLLSGNGLESPSALALGPDGDIYVTNRGGRPGQGQVIRIENTQSVPEPASALGLLTLSALSINRLRKGK